MIHRIRIAFKKFRYMVEALSGIMPGISDRQVRAMQAYQKSMGKIQDVEVLLARLEKFVKREDVTEGLLSSFRRNMLSRRASLVKRFLASGRSGFYLAVTKEGEVGAGDAFKRLARDAHEVPVSEITRLYIAKSYKNADLAMVRRLLNVSAVPEDWKSYFRDRIDPTGA